ncbi:MAG: aminopeptidase P family protein [Methanomassiliicoccales archaeon]
MLDGKVDAVVVANGSDTMLDHNFKYFVNAKSGIFEGSIAILKPSGVDVLTTPLETEALGGTEVSVSVWKNMEELKGLLKKKLSRIKRVGYNGSAINWSMYSFVRKQFNGKMVDCSSELRKCRAVKDKEEIRNIKEACRIVSTAADMIPTLLKEGMTERELAKQLTIAMYNEGGDGNSFSPIVSFGKTSAIPHYSPGAVKLRKGHFVLTDFGCRYASYCSDLTRTCFFGSANGRQKEMYETVLQAQTEAIESIRAGAVEEDVDAVARKVIDGSRFKGRFIHSLGHGLGLQVHDGDPALSRGRKNKLEEGMVVTVEPGVYVPGFGGVRIEDDVVVTSRGARVLTTARKELIEV